jgi:uncharacterized iron-regulated membrane protein
VGRSDVVLSETNNVVIIFFSLMVIGGILSIISIYLNKNANAAGRSDYKARRTFLFGRITMAGLSLLIAALGITKVLVGDALINAIHSHPIGI